MERNEAWPAKWPVRLVPAYSVLLPPPIMPLGNRGKRQSSREKDGGGKQWEMEKKGDMDKKKRERNGGGKALFRQPDNLPSPEHIYGCPLTPSRCSLWRQSQCCWPACRFPIISLAEGSCLLIHQQVWTCTLSWSSISCYNTTIQPGPKVSKFYKISTTRLSYLHVKSQHIQQVWVALVL